MSSQVTDSDPASWWPSALILGFGGLIITYACSAMRNDVPPIYWGLGWLVGPLLVLIGGGALVRSRRTGERGSPKNRR